MKRLKDYYQNRRRLKELKHDGIKFRTTKKKAREWFDILNEQIFGSLLKPVDKIYTTKFKDDHVYAFYHYYDNKDLPTEIELDTKFKDEKMFVEILAHEMIHHFQHLHDEPLGHGPSFAAWSDNFKLKGLNLYKAK